MGKAFTTFRQVAILDLSDDEWMERNEMILNVRKMMRSIPQTSKVKRSFNRKRIEKASLEVAPCSSCAIVGTCEKRRKHHLKGCKYPIPKKREKPLYTETEICYNTRH